MSTPGGLPPEDLSDLGDGPDETEGGEFGFFNDPPPPSSPPPPAPPPPPTSPPSNPSIPSQGQQQPVPEGSSGKKKRKSTISIYVSDAVEARWLQQAERTKKTKYEVLAMVIGSFKGEIQDMRKVIDDSIVITTVVVDLLPTDEEAVRYLGGSGGSGRSRGVQVNLTPAQVAALDGIGAKLGFEPVNGRPNRVWVAPLLNDRLRGTKERHPEHSKTSTQSASQE